MENPTQDSPPLDTLPALAEAAKVKRLAPADEEKATTLLSAQLKGGRAGITASIEPLLAFPWMVSVQAIAAVWSDLSQPMQRHLISSLAKEETEQARRLRMSIARAVFKIDASAGVRLAIGAAGDLKNPETGTLSTRSRQLFFHVFIGKGKPWLCLLPLEGAKGADALIHAAVETMPLCPPLSQLSILRWISAAGRFKKLTPDHIALIAKSVSRWNYRFQQGLKNDIPDLPEAITAVFKPERPEQPPVEEPAAKGAKGKGTRREAKEERSAGEAEGAPTEGAEEAEGAEGVEDAEVAEAPVLPDAEAEEATAERGEGTEGEDSAEGERPPRMTREERQAARRRERDARRDEQREQRRREREKEPEKGGDKPAERSERSERAERPAEAPRQRRAFDPKTFDLRDTLRSVESYVASLRQEVEQTKLQLRRKDDDSIAGRRARRGAREESPAVDVEELTRHNIRLEGTIAELKQQLEDLAADHEAVAESRALHGSEPLPEGSADQLRTLLNIKLYESYATFLEMKQDPLDRVFRLDYRDLLGSVFEVLQKEGVSLKAP